MRKKIITFTLFLAAMVTLAGCGTSKPKDNSPSAEATTEEGNYDMPQTTPVELTASDYVELGEYKGLTVEVEKAEITEEDVEEEIENYLEGYAEYKEIKDRKVVQEDDYVNLDYTCTIDGKKSEEYSDTDIDLKAGDGEMDEYLGSGLGDDFQLEKKVIGAKVGSTVSVDFTFPADYDDKAVAGKKGKMDVVIKKISEEVIPELTDEFVKEYTDSKTVDEYRKDTRTSLEEQAQEEADDSARDKLWNMIVDNATQKKDFTEDMIAQEKENVKIENQEVAEFYYGMEVEAFLKETTGMSLEEYAKNSLKGQCVQDLLVEAEGITVTDEALQAEMKQVAQESGLENPEDVTEYYSTDEIRQQLISKQLFEKLMSYNTVKTVPMAADKDADDDDKEITVETGD